MGSYGQDGFRLHQERCNEIEDRYRPEYALHVQAGFQVAEPSENMPVIYGKLRDNLYEILRKCREYFNLCCEADQGQRPDLPHGSYNKAQVEKTISADLYFHS